MNTYDPAANRRTFEQAATFVHPTGRHVSLSKDLGDRCRRDAHADTRQLADDPLVAPTRVLARKAQHQFTGRLRHRGPCPAVARRTSTASAKLAMPTEQRVRANEERRPALAAQQSAGRGKEHPVGLLQPRPRDLPAQNRQLVSKHHDVGGSRAQTAMERRPRPIRGCARSLLGQIKCFRDPLQPVRARFKSTTATPSSTRLRGRSDAGGEHELKERGDPGECSSAT
jgi:hypothetical protein